LPGLPLIAWPGSGVAHVIGLQAFIRAAYAEFHALSLLETAVAAAPYRAEVHEDIVPAIPRDESIALGCIEPLYVTSFT
jgi:hypothetical protein